MFHDRCGKLQFQPTLLAHWRVGFLSKKVKQGAVSPFFFFSRTFFDIRPIAVKKSYFAANFSNNQRQISFAIDLAASSLPLLIYFLFNPEIPTKNVSHTS